MVKIKTNCSIMRIWKGTPRISYKYSLHRNFSGKIPSNEISLHWFTYLHHHIDQRSVKESLIFHHIFHTPMRWIETLFGECCGALIKSHNFAEHSFCTWKMWWKNYLIVNIVHCASFGNVLVRKSADRMTNYVDLWSMKIKSMWKMCMYRCNSWPSSGGCWADAGPVGNILDDS